MYEDLRSDPPVVSWTKIVELHRQALRQEDSRQGTFSLMKRAANNPDFAVENEDDQPARQNQGW